MNRMTIDIYFDLKDHDKDANTNEITNRESLSAKSILTTFSCSKYILK